MKVLIYVIFGIIVVAAASEKHFSKPEGNYSLTGYVENIYYKDKSGGVEEKILCYIAINTDGIRGNKYHSCFKSDLCKFAEKAFLLNLKVNLIGSIDGGEHISNNIVGIEYADRKSTFWI